MKPRLIATVAPTTTPERKSPLTPTIASFARHLRAGHLSENTVESYLTAAEQLAEFLRWNRLPQEPSKIKREHVEGYIQDVLNKHRPTTAAIRYRSLLAFFRWLLEEEMIDSSPMAHMRMPEVDDAPPPILSEKEVRSLLKACEGKDFEARRDYAMVRIFLATGARRTEVAGIRLDEVDLDVRVIKVMGKGRRPRVAPLSHKAVQALDRYLRVRAELPRASEPWLWLGHKGRLTSNGVFQALRRRAVRAGLDFHPHQLRHTFAHFSKLDGHSDETIMRVGGWKNSAMLRHYGSSAATERALQDFHDRSPDDRF